MSEFITNAKLRIEAECLCDENDQLKAENAKLRELVMDMFDAIEVNGFDPTVERYGKRTVYY